MTQETYDVNNLQFNSKNFVNWLSFIVDIYDIPNDLKDKLIKYIKRTDVVRRRKELEDIFGW